MLCDLTSASILENATGIDGKNVYSESVGWNVLVGPLVYSM